MVVIRNGVRYHDDDAKRLGITGDKPASKSSGDGAKADTQQGDKAQRAPAGDKAQRPARSKSAATKTADTKADDKGADDKGGSGGDGTSAAAG